MPIFTAPRPSRASRFAFVRTVAASPPAYQTRRHRRVDCPWSLTTDYRMVSEDGLRAVCSGCHRNVGLNGSTVPAHLYRHSVRVPI